MTDSYRALLFDKALASIGSEVSAIICFMASSDVKMPVGTKTLIITFTGGVMDPNGTCTNKF